jgi:hypothetical protein
MTLSLNYSMGFTTGNLHDYVAESSFRGFDFAALWPVYKSLYLGAAFGYNLFYERVDRDTYSLSDRSAVTAQLYRYSDYWTTSLATRYYFMEPDSAVRAYAGLRIGVASVLNTTLVADLAFQDDPMGFLLAPEAGVLLRLNPAISGAVSALYNFSTASSAGYDSLSYLALQVGFVLHWQDY